MPTHKDLGFDAVKDSGARQEFDTGSVRDTRDGKGRYDLLPPIAIRRLAQHFENGARKYGDRNWERGQPVSRYMDSGLRHMFAYLEGQRDEDHLAAATWNVLAAIHTEAEAMAGNLPAELADVPAREPARLTFTISARDEASPAMDEAGESLRRFSGRDAGEVIADTGYSRRRENDAAAKGLAGVERQVQHSNPRGKCMVCSAVRDEWWRLTEEARQEFRQDDRICPLCIVIREHREAVPA